MGSIATPALRQDSPRAARRPVSIAGRILPQGNASSRAGPPVSVDTATPGLRQDSPPAARLLTNATIGVAVEEAQGTSIRGRGQDGESGGEREGLKEGLSSS